MRSLLPLSALTLFSFACGDKDTQDPEDTSPPEDTAPVDQCSPEALRDDALANGEVLWDGVTLEASTPMADLLGEPEAYDGQFLQIEGGVTELCTSQGCWAALTDADGNTMNLKVVDGALDFREHTEIGYYAIGEGYFEPDGGHGPQVEITGAVVGTVLCN